MPPPSRRRCTSASWDSTDACAPCPACCPRCGRRSRRASAGSIVPYANEAEAALVEGIEVIGAVSLGDVARLARRRGRRAPTSTRCPRRPPPADEHRPAELAEVIGQRDAVDALIAAAAGGHHMLMCGPPGAGKTMLASRLPGILPALDDAAALEVAAIRSLSGRARSARSSRRRRSRLRTTARASRHSSAADPVSCVRARSPAPRTVCCSSTKWASSRASVLDALRQPLEKGEITIHRAGVTASFPASLPADPRHEPLPLRQLRRARRQLRLRTHGDPALPRAPVGSAAGSRRHRARAGARLGRARVPTSRPAP